MNVFRITIWKYASVVVHYSHPSQESKVHVTLNFIEYLNMLFLYVFQTIVCVQLEPK